MKFNKEQLDILKQNIDGFFDSKSKELNHQSILKTKIYLARTYKENGHSFIRFCFDAFHATGLVVGDGIGIPGKAGKFADGVIVIPDCDDDHIYSALRKILKTVKY